MDNDNSWEGNGNRYRFHEAEVIRDVDEKQKAPGRYRRPFIYFNIYENLWCPGTELNRRHEDFQSSALPTELPGQKDFLYTLTCAVMSTVK